MRTTVFKSSKRIRWSDYRNYSVESLNIISNAKTIRMKTFSLILFIIVFYGHTFGQKTTNDYLDTDRNNSAPMEVMKLVETASEMDVLKNPDFDGRNKPYRVVFKSNKGSIELTYDKNGKVVHSKEVFKNVNMPYQLKKYIMSKYPNHRIVGNKYKLYSKNGKVTRSSYNLVVQNGEERKHLQFDNGID